MNRKNLTMTFMMISTRKNPLFSMVYRKKYVSALRQRCEVNFQILYNINVQYIKTTQGQIQNFEKRVIRLTKTDGGLTL